MEYLEKIAKKAIDSCVKEKAKLLMCVDGFQTPEEALHLKALLWYAREKGVEVTFVPK